MEQAKRKTAMQQRRAYWRRMVEEVRRSGQGVRAFCRERRVDEHLFYYWRRVLAKEEGAVVKWAEEPRFLLVSPPQPEELAESNRSLELVVERGWRLRIPAGADETMLRAVLAALGAVR
jgi:hypothetical protein